MIFTQNTRDELTYHCLHLKTGQSFHGRSFGAPRASLRDHTESMTDPSYRGQILGIQCSAIVVADVAENFSHHSAVESLPHGVDTRTTPVASLLAQMLLLRHLPRAILDPSIENLVDQVSTKYSYQLNPMGTSRSQFLTFGVKANILLTVCHGTTISTPFVTSLTSIPDQCPGNPSQCMEAVSKLARHFGVEQPIFESAYRMTFGNRGHNQPVLALASAGSIKAGRVYVTSQNHQYALTLSDPFPKGWEPFFINCNDSSVEGIKSTPESGKRVWGVQFHPESAGGPLDTIEMFTDFVDECRLYKAENVKTSVGTTMDAASFTMEQPARVQVTA
ncbi:hypothetical protein BDR07DRAFT_1454439 [Suillus spraguei]|nr:hypothetical protein BDR07DRAFT_1454439 [Suillus spraguei]